MPNKNCPKCKKSLKPSVMECECGYDFTLMDCPGCEHRIPDDSVVCSFCKYDLIEGKPAKKKGKKNDDDVAPAGNVVVSTGRKKVAPLPDPVEEEEYEEVPKEKRRVPAGMHLTHSIAMGNHGVPDPNYSELFWSKRDEVNDETLLAWAQAFRAAYAEKISGRKGQFLSNYAIYNWCRSDAKWVAARYDKKGQNDVLVENAARILELLGGNDNK